MASDAIVAEAGEPDAKAPDTPERKDAMASISGQLCRPAAGKRAPLSTGDRAALRRIYLTRSRAADGVVVKLLHVAEVSPAAQEKDFDRWRLVAHVAAMLSGTGAVPSHAAGARLGAVLHAAGYSENRLLRLTAVRGAALHDQIVLAARMLAQAGAGPIDLWTVFDLAGRNPDKAEHARIRIAQNYYAADARSGEGSSK